MNIYFEPVNLNQWNMFERVSGPGHIEPFLAVKSMREGDIVLLHVGSQDKRYQSGIYAYGTIVQAPYILRDSPTDYCNNKLTVDVKITKISFGSPLISHDEFKQWCHQFRSVHLLKDIDEKSLADIIANINGVDVMIEHEETTDNRDRLLDYYQKLIAAKGVTLKGSQGKALKTLVDNMTEDAAGKKMSKMEEHQITRLMAYANAISKLTKEQEETADALIEVIDATAEDPVQEAVMINGNKFIYEKGSLDVKKYADKLSAIGNEQKGNTWSIYVDDEGELVIY